jgi:putative ubiquitin-RnfH superfamily antitoxin RatB of RatAB toxin-antitoxin module
MDERIPVSVVYALPQRQVVVRLQVERGTTVAAACELSGLSRRFPEIAEGAGYAIFGKAVAETQLVRAGDRIEILRPLLIDPKEGRRRAVSRSQKTNRA